MTKCENLFMYKVNRELFSCDITLWQSAVQRGQHTKLCIISSLLIVDYPNLLQTLLLGLSNCFLLTQSIVVWGNFPFIDLTVCFATIQQKVHVQIALLISLKFRYFNYDVNHNRFKTHVVRFRSWVNKFPNNILVLLGFFCIELTIWDNLHNLRNKLYTFLDYARIFFSFFWPKYS